MLRALVAATAAACAFAAAEGGLGLSLWMHASTGNAAGVRARFAAGETDLDARGAGGQTALMAACLRGHVDAALALLELGADAAVGEEQGYTCLHGSAFQGRGDVVRAVLASRFAATVPNTRHDDGFAPIHRACWGREARHADAVAAFLEARVPHDLRAKSGETPLELARKAKNAATVEVLEAAAARAAARAAEEAAREL